MKSIRWDCFSRWFSSHSPLHHPLDGAAEGVGEVKADAPQYSIVCTIFTNTTAKPAYGGGVLLPAEVLLSGANLKMILDNSQVDMRISGH